MRLRRRLRALNPVRWWGAVWAGFKRGRKEGGSQSAEVRELGWDDKTRPRLELAMTYALLGRIFFAEVLDPRSRSLHQPPAAVYHRQTRLPDSYGRLPHACHVHIAARATEPARLHSHDCSRRTLVQSPLPPARPACINHARFWLDQAKL